MIMVRRRYYVKRKELPEYSALEGPELPQDEEPRPLAA